MLLGRTGRGDAAGRALAAVGADSCSVITVSRCDAGSSEEAAHALALPDHVSLGHQQLNLRSARSESTSDVGLAVELSAGPASGINTKESDFQISVLITKV